MSMFGDGLDQAVQKAFTRPVPKSAGAQMRYLVKQLKGTERRRPDAAGLPAHRGAVREGPDQEAPPGPRRPHGARGRRRGGSRRSGRRPGRRRRPPAAIVIDTRARLGYTAPIGTTDQDRIRHLTVALPPQYAARLFDAREQGAGDDRLREIAAEALKDVYFQDGGRRAGSLEEVRLTDVEHLEFDL